MNITPGEENLWKWIKKLKFVYRNQLHLNRIENSAGNGMADVNGCFKGIEFWLELKKANKPSNAKTPIKIKFQDGQPIWLKNRYRAGGRVFVAILIGKYSKANRYLIPASRDLIDKMQNGLTLEELGALSIVNPGASKIEFLAAIVKHPQPKHSSLL
jgi:penicillin-binding protein-related factor A (putative recombinase)